MIDLDDPLAPPRSRGFLEGWITHLLIFANVVVFGLEVWITGETGRSGGGLFDMLGPSREAQRMLGVMSRVYVLEQGHVWRLITCTFFHYGLMHIAFNMLSLWNIGRFLERAIGSTRFLALYMLSAIGGSLACLLGPAPVAGASGAIYGLIGIGLVYAIRAGGLLGQALRRQFLEFLITGIVLSLLPGISFLGHAGGFLAGFALSWLVIPKNAQMRAVGAGISGLAWGLLGLVPLCFGLNVLYGKTKLAMPKLPDFVTTSEEERPAEPKKDFAVLEEKGAWTEVPLATVSLREIGAAGWSIDVPKEWTLRSSPSELEIRGPDGVRLMVQASNSNETPDRMLARLTGRPVPEKAPPAAETSAEGEPPSATSPTRTRYHVRRVGTDLSVIVIFKISRSFDEALWRPVFDRVAGSIRKE